MKKIFVHNRKLQNLSVVFHNENGKGGTVFVMHGLGDSKGSKHIQSYIDAFLERDFRVISFDTANTFGESDGDFENATLTGYYEDLEDVVAWTRLHGTLQSQYILVGHSLGAISSALHAQKNNEDVIGLVMLSSPVNGTLSKSTYPADVLVDWEKSGYLIEDWEGYQVKLKWSYMKDRERYDLLDRVGDITMPVLMIAGENDRVTPYDHQQLLFDEIVSPKEIHILPGAGHTFRDDQVLKKVHDIIAQWLIRLKDINEGS